MEGILIVKDLLLLESHVNFIMEIELYQFQLELK